MAAREPETTRTDEWDQCFCCGDDFLATQLDDDGHCTMCAHARASYRGDGIPAGRICCRRALTEMKKQGIKP